MGNSSKRGRDLGAIDEEERQYAIGSHTLEELDEKYVFFFFFFFFMYYHYQSLPPKSNMLLDTQTGLRIMASPFSSPNCILVFSTP